jgi:hypothetical protein
MRVAGPTLHQSISFRTNNGVFPLVAVWPGVRRLADGRDGNEQNISSNSLVGLLEKMLQTEAATQPWVMRCVS